MTNEIAFLTCHQKETVVAPILKKQGFRVSADLRNEKITYKIRDHALQKIPYLVVVGDKERDSNLVAVRARGGADLGPMSIEAFEKRLQEEISKKVSSSSQGSAVVE